MFSLITILRALINYQGPAPDLLLTGAEIDSRRIIPGSMFIALPGARMDGHDFVSDAFKKGALIALIQKKINEEFPVINLQDDEQKTIQAFPMPPFCLQVSNSLKALQQIASYWRRELDLRVIGITGSVGKSSTKELVAEVLSQKYHTCKNPGNYNNEIGLPLTLLNISGGHQYAVLEMGFYYPGEIAYLCKIAQPQVGIVTNIGTVHAERAGSQNEIVKGKTELVQALPASPIGYAILNKDDPLVIRMAKATKANVVTYGTQDGSDYQALDITSHGLDGIEFDVKMPNGIQHFTSPLPGRHSVMTCLRAIAVADIEGLTINEIRNGLASAQSQLRMTAFRHPSGAIILDDSYNATPESTLAALDLLGDMDGRRVAVLGDMLELGEYEKSGHKGVGSHVVQTADFFIAIGPRSKMMVESALKNGFDPKKIEWFEDASQSLHLIKEYCEKNSIILVKGSHGMRMDRITAFLKEME